MSFLKRIPLWIKLPVSVFLNEIGRFPVSVVFAHMYKSYADTKPLPDTVRLQAHHQCHQQICDYLCRKYRYLFSGTEGIDTDSIHDEHFPIWVFWWQGEDNAPPLVQACISSIRNHACGHPVNVLDSANYRNYVTIPEHILRKMQAGTISLTHFSDILRMNLIAQHGGFWLDATIFCTRDITGPQFEHYMFTVRNPGEDLWNVSCWEWSGFAIYGRQGAPLFCMMRDLLDAYWQDHNSLIDYFLIDYGIRVICDHCNAVKDAFGQIPANNRNIYYFQEHFADPAKKASYNWKDDNQTYLYKLSWKTSYPLVTADGEDTVYAAWLAENTERQET